MFIDRKKKRPSTIFLNVHKYADERILPYELEWTLFQYKNKKNNLFFDGMNLTYQFLMKATLDRSEKSEYNAPITMLHIIQISKIMIIKQVEDNLLQIFVDK